MSTSDDPEILAPDTSAYGEPLGEHLGIESAPSVRVRLLNKGFFAATRVSFPAANFGLTKPLPAEDAFIVSLQFRETRPSELWFAGRRLRSTPAGARSMAIFDLNAETSVDIRDPFDTLLMYVPRSALVAVSEELGSFSPVDLALSPGCAVQDPVVAHLGASLLPLIEAPCPVSDLLVDHVAAGLCLHLVQNYGTRRRTSPSAPTQITNVQLQRAKELLRAHLDGRILLEELARECGLSRAHFSRVFKQSTGQTPHGWLTQQRVAASRDLLANASLSLADVARRCGFANQSHFTRVFAKSEGVAPGAWRRSRRMPYRSSPSSPW